MSGTRFARTGRCRFYICLGLLIIMVSVVAIFQSSQQQLEETREQRLRCEHQQEALNERVKNVVEQKYQLEKTHERELKELKESRRNLEQKMKELKENHDKELMDARLRFDQMQQNYEILQSEHTELTNECSKKLKQHLEDTNGMEKKLQSLKSELKSEKNSLGGELNLWKEKYQMLAREKKQLKSLVGVDEAKSELQKRIENLEHILVDYEKHCSYKSELALQQELQQQQQQQINAPLDVSIGEHNASTSAQHVFDKPHVEKSFNKQSVVSPGLYRISVNLTNTKPNVNATNNKSLFKIKKIGGLGVNDVTKTIAEQTAGVGEKLLPFSAQNNRSLIINSVENFQILPKTIKKLSEETETQLKQQPADTFVQQNHDKSVNVGADAIAGAGATNEKSTRSKLLNELKNDGHLKPATNSTSTSTNANLPPLPLPPNQEQQQPQRKLPENVAPIPANFDELIKNDDTNQKHNNNNNNNNNINNNKNTNTNNNNKNDKKQADAAQDINAALEEIPKNDNDAAGNNRYANVVNDFENNAVQKQAGVVGGAAAAAGNEDSGAHEIKDHDPVNEQNFNLPADDDTNFFDGGVDGKNDGVVGAGAEEKRKPDDNEDDDILGADAPGNAGGDIAVKNHNHLLDADDLNNEVAGDQGLHGDGLHLEEGNAEEDEDEDDYSNPAARQQGAQAIRN